MTQLPIYSYVTLEMGACLSTFLAEPFAKFRLALIKREPSWRHIA